MVSYSGLLRFLSFYSTLAVVVKGDILQMNEAGSWQKISNTVGGILLDHTVLFRLSVDWME